MKTCSIDGCEYQLYARTLCHKHYDAARDSGDLDKYPRRSRWGTLVGAPMEHGTLTAYIKYKCRCDICKANYKEYMRPYNEARRAKRAERTAESPNYGHQLDKAIKAKLQDAKDSRNNICDCCGRMSRRLVIDHIHGTNIVRGFICDLCNTGIGKLGDNEEGLMKAMDYLQRDPIVY